MSTHIVDRIEAIRFPAEATGHYADRFLIVELGGDNNLRRASDNRRARSWSAMTIGEEWEVIGTACRLAASCSGGMTKLHGRATKPESYIRAYRKALANASTMETARQEKGLSLTARIRFNADDRKGWHYKELVKKGRTPQETTEYGTAYAIFKFDLSCPEELTLWLAHCHGNGWNNAEVCGPGEV
jgi:hypothetical protein